MAKTRTIHKSAVSGRIVSAHYAKTHPKTTYRQTVTVSKPKEK